MDDHAHTGSIFDSRAIQFFGSRKEIAAVYVFGSYGTGRHHPQSDVDVGILLCPEFSGSAEALKQEFMVILGRILRKDIHPVIMNHAGEVLLKQILSKGKPILVNHPKVDKQFKMVSLSRIADFQYHLEKMQAGLAKKIMET